MSLAKDKVIKKIFLKDDKTVLNRRLDLLNLRRISQYLLLKFFLYQNSISKL